MATHQDSAGLSPSQLNPAKRQSEQCDWEEESTTGLEVLVPECGARLSVHLFLANRKPELPHHGGCPADKALQNPRMQVWPNRGQSSYHLPWVGPEEWLSLKAQFKCCLLRISVQVGYRDCHLFGKDGKITLKKSFIHKQYVLSIYIVLHAGNTLG